MKKFLIFIIGMVFIIFLLIVASPAILSTRYAKDLVLNTIKSRIPGTLQIDHWTLGWISGFHIEGFHFTGAQKEIEVRVPKIDSPKGLLYRIMAIHDLGDVILKDPEVILKQQEAPKIPQSTETLSGSRTDKKMDPHATITQLPVSGHIQVINGTLQAELSDSRTLTVVRNADIDLDITDSETPVRFALVAASGSGEGKMTGKGALRFTNLNDFLNKAGMTGDLSIGNWDLHPIFTAIATQRSVPMVNGTLNGKFHFTVSKENANNLEGDLTVTGFGATGGPLGSDHPKMDRMAVSVRGERAGGSLNFESLSIQSPLLNLHSSGKVTGTGAVQFTGRGNLDLAIAALNLPQTMKLRKDLILDKGTLEIEGRFEQDAESSHFEGKGGVDNLSGAVEGRRIAWREPMRFSISGNKNKSGSIQLDDLHLSSSFLNARGSGNLESLKIQASADIQSALTELGTIFPLENWNGQGRAELTAEIKITAENRHTVHGVLTGDEVALKKGERLLIPPNGPRVTFDGDIFHPVKADNAAGIEAGGIRLVLDTWLGQGTVTLDQVVKIPAGSSPEMKDMALSANVNTGELSKLLSNLDALPPGAAIAGKTTVTMKGDILSGGTDLEGAVHITDFIYTPPKSPPISEEKIDFLVKVRKQPNDAKWEMARVSLSSTPVSITGTGALYPVDPEREVKGEGVLDVDLALLSPYLKVFDLKNVIMKGKSKEPFTFRSKTKDSIWDFTGPDTVFSTALNIERMEGFGMDLADAKLPLQMEKGVLSAHLKGSVNHGTLDVVPKVYLDPKSGEMRFEPKSKILTGVQLTDEMAKELLSRFHPLFSGAMSTQGVMGLEMETFHWPLFENPGDKTFSGRLLLQNVRIETSGFLEELSRFLDLKERRLEIDEQAIDFSCEKKRISTSPLQFTIGQQPVTLSGTMGFDHTIEYSIKTPVTEKLVGKEVFPLVEGMVIELPIGGTITHPVIDSTKLEAAVSGLLQQAAGRQLELKTDQVKEKIQKQAEKLLKKIFK